MSKQIVKPFIGMTVHVGVPDKSPGGAVERKVRPGVIIGIEESGDVEVLVFKVMGGVEAALFTFLATSHAINPVDHPGHAVPVACSCAPR